MCGRHIAVSARGVPSSATGQHFTPEDSGRIANASATAQRPKRPSCDYNSGGNVTQNDEIEDSHVIGGPSNQSTATANVHELRRALRKGTVRPRDLQ